MATIRVRLPELLAAGEQQAGRPVALEDVAQATGIPLPALSALYDDRADRISLEWLADLCAYFRCTPGELLDYDPDAQRRVGEDQPAAVDAREIVERWERTYGQDERPVD